MKLRDDEQYGVAVVRRALQEPLRQIAKNSGVDGAVVVDRVSKAEGASGYNAATDTYEDLVRAGVIESLEDECPGDVPKPFGMGRCATQSNTAPTNASLSANDIMPTLDVANCFISRSTS